MRTGNSGGPGASRGGKGGPERRGCRVFLTGRVHKGEAPRRRRALDLGFGSIDRELWESAQIVLCVEGVVTVGTLGGGYRCRAGRMG